MAAVLGSEPHPPGGQRAIFLSGDEAGAEVVTLLEDAGFLGGLRAGGQIQQVRAQLAAHNLIRLS